jgi:hypothetical protein
MAVTAVTVRTVMNAAVTVRTVMNAAVKLS